MGHGDQPAPRTSGGKKDGIFQNLKAFQNGWRTAGVQAEKWGHSCILAAGGCVVNPTSGDKLPCMVLLMVPTFGYLCASLTICKHP